MRKKIQIEIDDDDYPMLFEIKKSSLSSVCYDIFKTGYSQIFPDRNLSRNNKINEHHIESLKHELIKINEKIEDKNVEDKLDNFSNVVSDLIGINFNSSKKGRFGEDFVLNYISTKFPDHTLKTTRSISHCGDGILTTPNGNKIMIEVKNYSINIDDTELEKLIYDMKFNKINYSIFISLKTAFVGKRRFDIKNYGDKTIVFVPYAGEDPGKIENSVVLVERLQELGSKNRGHKIVDTIAEHLEELNDITQNLAKIRENYLTTENGIKSQLNTHYKFLRDCEIDTQKSIDRIWNRIGRDLGIKKLCKKTNTESDSVKLRSLREIMNVLKKHEVYIESNLKMDTNDDQCWILKKNDNVVGTLCKMRGYTDIEIKGKIVTKLTIKNSSKVDLITKSLDSALSNIILF